MKLTKDGHVISFKLGAKELNAPDRAWIRFVERLKRAIPTTDRIYHEEAKSWAIDVKYEGKLKLLINHYFED